MKIFPNFENEINTINLNFYFIMKTLNMNETIENK